MGPRVPAAVMESPRQPAWQSPRLQCPRPRPNSLRRAGGRRREKQRKASRRAAAASAEIHGSGRRQVRETPWRLSMLRGAFVAERMGASPAKAWFFREDVREWRLPIRSAGRQWISETASRSSIAAGNISSAPPVCRSAFLAAPDHSAASRHQRAPPHGEAGTSPQPAQ